MAAAPIPNTKADADTNLRKRPFSTQDNESAAEKKVKQDRQLG